MSNAVVVSREGLGIKWSDPVPLKLLVQPNGKIIEHIGRRAGIAYEYLKDRTGKTDYYFFTNIIALLRKNFGDNVVSIKCSKQIKHTLKPEIKLIS